MRYHKTLQAIKGQIKHLWNISYSNNLFLLFLEAASKQSNT